MGFTNDVFISYSHVDGAWAQKLSASLTAEWSQGLGNLRGTSPALMFGTPPLGRELPCVPGREADLRKVCHGWRLCENSGRARK